MAIPKPTDRWNVLVISADEEKTSTYRLAVSTCVGSLRKQWSEEQGVPGDCTVFRLVDGTVAGDEMTLLEVGEGQLGSRTVNLWVEEQMMTYLGLYHKQEEALLPLDVTLSKTPAEIHPQIQRIFSLSDDRPFRLRSPLLGPLVSNLSLGEQGIRPDGVLHVDLAYEVTVKEPWEGVKERRLLFSSELISDLSIGRSECPGCPERLMLGRRQLDMDQELATLQQIYLQTSTLEVECVSQRTVVTLFGGRLQEQRVWPTETARGLIGGAPRGSEVLFEGRPLLPHDVMKKLGVQEGSMVTSCARVLVTLSDGRRELVRLPDRATVSDLHQAVLELEKDPDFVLRSGGRLLDDNETVDRLAEPASVEVERQETPFLVSLHDRSVRWVSKGPPLRPSDFLYQLAGKGSESWGDLTERTLVCAGCGRTISLAEDDFQLLPAACCRVRSTELREVLPPPTADAVTQAECWIPRSTAEASTVELPPSPGQPAPEVVGTAEETDSDQAIARPPKRLPLRVQCGFDSLLGEMFDADLDLVGAPTGLQVKQQLASLLDTSEDELRLSRAVAHVTTAYRVCDDQRPGWEGFCDQSGGVERGLEVQSQDYELVMDDQVFVVVPNRRSCVAVSLVAAQGDDDNDDCYVAEYEGVYETVTVNGVPTKRKWWRRIKKSATGLQKLLNRGGDIKRSIRKRKKKKEEKAKEEEGEEEEIYNISPPMRFDDDSEVYEALE